MRTDNELEQAQERYKDAVERGEESIGENALDFIDGLLTPEEAAESDFRVRLIEEFISARNEQGISQKRLEQLSGVKQPVIARMERGITSPQLDTILKLLIPLGKTLAVVPIEAVKPS